MTFTSASNSSEELLQIARNAVISGHRATAARMVNRVLENDPSNKEAWRLLAECMTDPETKRKCLIKAGDLPNRSEKAALSSDRYTTSPTNRIELPPEPVEEESDPVILPPRKYRPSPRAESPVELLERKKKDAPRTARTRKTDPKSNHKRKSSGCFVLFVLALIVGLLAAGYLYFKPDLNRISDLIFPSLQSENQTDPQVDGLIPPEEIPTETPTPEPIPDVSEPDDQESTEPAELVEKIIQVGQSVGGRPIEVFQFGSGETQRLIVAGMHGGNEYNTVNLADELIVYIHANPDVIPADVTLFILRNLNPDGEARAHGVDGRVNDNGVDLNRNWDSHWKIDWNRENCWTYRAVTGGPFPASEPETKALLDFITANQISGIINYHSAALGIFPGGQPFEDKSSRLAEALHAVTNYSYPPIDIGCEYTGMFTDWAADNGIPAVDIELTNHSDSDFDQNLKAMNVLLAWSPDADAKNLPDGLDFEGSEDGDESPLAGVQDAADGFFKDVYGLIMSNFEER